MRRLSRTTRPLLTLTSMLLAMLLLLPPSTSFSQDSTSCEDKLAVAKSIAQAAIDKARVAEARESELKAQRNTEIEEHLKTRSQRDLLNGELVAVKSRSLDLEAKVAPLVVENTLLVASVRKLKRQRWIFAAVAGGVGLGAGVFATVWVAK